jgi:hypothetical protein
MTRVYEEFLHNYGISNIQTVHSRSFARRMDNYNYTSAQYYNTQREEEVLDLDMDISRSGFERLVDLDKRHNACMTQDREEAYLRKNYPALKDAYDKYLMLLALYR